MPEPLLDTALARRWLDDATEDLLATRSEIDRLNVYPVPDGDTGTNLHLTMAGARDGAGEVAGPSVTVGELFRAAAGGALRGARGNSGVIVSQLLHGWADALTAHTAAGPAEVARAFVLADEQAWVAVESPCEGTILSASRAAAAAAAGCVPDADLCTVVEAAARAARTALGLTTGQLDVLARAGVVDAGAAGLVVILDALAGVVTGRRQRPTAPAPAGQVDHGQELPGQEPSGPGVHGQGVHGQEQADPVPCGQESYEVMYLLDAPAETVPDLRARLARLGTSVVVVGGEGQWNVHVHTDEPVAAVQAGAIAGRPHDVTTTPFLDFPVGDDATADAPVMVACVSSPGLQRVFADAGALTLCHPSSPSSGPLPTVDDLVAAVRAAGSRSVVLLPNDPGVLTAARGVAAVLGDDVRVHLVPTLAEVQGLAAIAVHDPVADPSDDVVAMATAAGLTRYGCVTTGQALDGGPPDLVGLVGSSEVAVGRDVWPVAVAVLDGLLAPGGELVTLVTGRGTPPDVVRAVVDELRVSRPHLEVLVLDGGQSGTLLAVGVE